MEIKYWTFSLALLGALSWLPQLISWINSLFMKPELRFVPDETTEIGYTTFGPILNQYFAISTSRKDALIERIILEVTHEKGEKHSFYWKYLDERGPELTSINGEGESMQWRKNQSAIALKVSSSGLAEKKIGFQDTYFQEKLIDYTKAHNEKLFYLERIQTQNYKDKAIKSKEFLDTLDFIKKGFYWKEGRYTVDLFVYETTLKNPHTECFKFELTKSDIEQLEKNIKETQDYIKNLILYKGRASNEWPKHYWNWANPKFTRMEKK